MEKNKQLNLAYFVAAALLVLLFQSFWTDYRTVERIPYSQFLTLIENGKIADVVVRETTVTGTLKEPVNCPGSVLRTVPEEPHENPKSAIGKTRAYLHPGLRRAPLSHAI